MCCMRAEFLPNSELCEEIAVNRDVELAKCIDALTKRHQNLLLYGDRGVGKTFFLRHILHRRLEQSEHSLVVVPFRVTGIRAYDPSDSAAAFTRAILTNLCAHVWTVLMGHSYTDLRDSLGSSDGELSVAGAEAKLLRRIYRQLMFAERRAVFDDSSAVGFSAVVTGKRDQRRQQSGRQSDLLPFEFFAFLDEITAKILPSFGKRRFCVVCDDANVLTWGQQRDILERHLDVFSDGRVQFLFVVGTHSWDRALNIPSNFEARFALEGLAPKDIQEIMRRIENPPAVTFPIEAIERLCDSFGRNTRHVLQAAELADRFSVENGSQEVTKRALDHAIAKLMEMEREYEEMVSRMAASDKPDVRDGR